MKGGIPIPSWLLSMLKVSLFFVSSSRIAYLITWLMLGTEVKITYRLQRAPIYATTFPVPWYYLSIHEPALHQFSIGVD